MVLRTKVNDHKYGLNYRFFKKANESNVFYTFIKNSRKNTLEINIIDFQDLFPKQISLKSKL